MLENNKPKLISISEIVSWLYCPRKLYLTKIKKIKQPLTKEMLAGRIKHEVIGYFSNREKELIQSLDKNYDKIDLIFRYEDFLKAITEEIFAINYQILEDYKIDLEELEKKIKSGFLEDLKLRVASIKQKLEQGFFKEELWKNLDSVYISELSLESEALGLKGRVDRVEINNKKNLIIPFELKSRAETIYHSDELQLTAYAMLLEEKYKIKIEKGIIESGNNKQEIFIEEKNKQEILKIRDDILNLNHSLIPPMLSNFNKCRSCSINNICPEVE